MKTGLVLEGGAFRTIFSCGVCDAFLDAGLPLPDYTVGVSAGIAYGVSYLSRQSRRNLKLLTTYANDKRYMGVGNFLDRRNRSYFGLKFSYETIPNELLPFDYETFAAYPGTAEAVVTNLNTGRAEYLEVPRKDEHFLLLQATCAIPLMFPVIHLDGQPYLDGGCAMAIPYQRAIDSGFQKIVLVLTRQQGYRKLYTPRPVLHAYARYFRRYPKFIRALCDIPTRYDRQQREIDRLEQAGRIFVIRPQKPVDVSHTERDTEKLTALYQDGRREAERRLEALRAYLAE